VLVRDSKDLTITPLAFTPAAWRGFTDALKNDQFGRPESWGATTSP
jgi:hypothetical protein